MHQHRLLIFLSLILLLLAGIYRSFSVISIEGNSMYPTFRKGDKVLAQKIFSKLNPGDIVVAYSPYGDLVVKRILEKDPDGIFLIGDNIDNSEDSRDFGRIPASYIVGRIVP